MGGKPWLKYGGEEEQEEERETAAGLGKPWMKFRGDDYRAEEDAAAAEAEAAADRYSALPNAPFDVYYNLLSGGADEILPRAQRMGFEFGPDFKTLTRGSEVFRYEPDTWSAQIASGLRGAGQTAGGLAGGILGAPGGPGGVAAGAGSLGVIGGETADWLVSQGKDLRYAIEGMSAMAEGGDPSGVGEIPSPYDDMTLSEQFAQTKEDVAIEAAGMLLGEAAGPVMEGTAKLFSRQSPTKQLIAKQLSAGGDMANAPRTAEYEISVPATVIDEPTLFQRMVSEGTPQVRTSKTAQETIKQGWDRGVIAPLKASSKATKQKLLDMVKMRLRIRENRLIGIDQRPSDILGDSLMTRWKIIRDTNNRAGRDIPRVAETLKGQQVEYQPVIARFVQDLSDMGITMPTGDQLAAGAKMELDFRGSILHGKGLKKVQRYLNDLVEMMYDRPTPDAHDLHRFKQYIDEIVTYGKKEGGMEGKAKLMVKRMRRGIDKVLDKTFPAYNEVNSVYAETREAIDALQDIAGSKIDLGDDRIADKATGQLMRRISSNAQSRTPLLLAAKDIDAVAKKYNQAALPARGRQMVKFGDRLLEMGGEKAGKQPVDLDDSLFMQALFISELDDQFGAVFASHGFKQEIATGSKQAMMAMKSRDTLWSVLADKAGQGLNAMRNINEDESFLAIMELLEEGL